MLKKFHWKDHWALIPIALFYLMAAGIYLLAGEHAQIAVADNLDLFQAQYQMLRLTGTFYAQDAESLFLNGISRDVLPTEYSLTSLLYQIFEPLVAYELLYFVKITIAIVSFSLLAAELDRYGALYGPSCSHVAGGATAASAGEGAAAAGDNASETEPAQGGRRRSPDDSRATRRNLALVCGLAYGLLNLFPSFGIAFASIPLFVWLVLRLEREDSRRRCVFWLFGILLYPWLSYFSYFGFFLIAYLCGAFVIKSVCDSVRRKGFHPDLRLLMSAAALSLGSVLFEYRLFGQMLFTEEETIRETMVQTSLSAGQILQWIMDVLVNGVDMHCESAHRWIVLPVCVIYFVILNAGYLRRREVRRAATDIYNLAAAALLFNAVVYGLYYSEAVRGAVETLLPPLTGFQFNRTAYFNPFLWYGMFFVAMYRLVLWLREQGPGSDRRLPGAVSCLLPWGAAFAAICVIVMSDTTYNDLLSTAKADVKRVLGMEAGNDLDYAEFYSEDLFGAILEDIEYDGEKAVAYGLHPAILNYSGISTLDGYLGFYSQEYKESFREVIAPALEENEATRVYYDDWGARCYIYSGHNTTVVEAVRSYTHTEDTIDIDTQALRDLGCQYIFSRIRITNADEKELVLIGTYADGNSPYTIYLYTL